MESSPSTTISIITTTIRKVVVIGHCIMVDTVETLMRWKGVHCRSPKLKWKRTLTSHRRGTFS